MSKNQRHGGKSGHDDHDDHAFGHKGKLLVGTNGDNVLSGGSRNDLIFGLKGNDTLDGGAGNDWLFGGKGDDRLLGGAGNDVLVGDSGSVGRHWNWHHHSWWTPKGQYDDYLDGGAGNDFLLAGRGDDVANYTLSENRKAHDVYDGGKGFDTLQLTLTSAELKLASVQKDIAAFEAFLDRKANPNSDNGSTFQFKSFNLDVRNFEDLNIVTVGGNAAPVAGNDSFALVEDIALTVPGPGVLANDSDAEGSALTVMLDVGPAHGSVALNADGSFTYTPTLNYNGPDSFTYKAFDGTLASAIATVSLTVNAVNDQPLADPDAYSTNEDTQLIVAADLGVLVGDTDVDGDSLSAQLVQGPDHGALTLNGDGSFTYTPTLNYNGPDSFTYKAFDGALYSGEATVSLSVNVPPVPPVAKPDVIERTGAGGPIHVAVIADGTNSAQATRDQIADSTVFNFGGLAGDLVDVLSTGTAEYGSAIALNFAKYDAVVIGEQGGGAGYFDNPELFSALTNFVNLGHGVVSTGIFAYKIASYSGNLTLMAQADFVSPTGDAGTAILLPGPIGITVDSSHPITAGVSNFTTSDWYELANDIDPDNVGHILATGGSSSQAAIVYADDVGTLGSARTVFLGAMHMADPAFSSNWTRVGSPDKILEQAIAWATGTATDEDTPLVIDSATLLANDEEGNGGPLSIASVSATSTRGASVSLDIDGNVVYDPTAALNYLNAGEIVQDSFDYRVIDSNGAEAFATASLSVAGRDDVI